MCEPLLGLVISFGRWQNCTAPVLRLYDLGRARDTYRSFSDGCICPMLECDMASLSPQVCWVVRRPVLV